jgi:hypothetical protein
MRRRRRQHQSRDDDDTRGDCHRVCIQCNVLHDA